MIEGILLAIWFVLVGIAYQLDRIKEAVERLSACS